VRLVLDAVGVAVLSQAVCLDVLERVTTSTCAAS
jgi:hypothetical protein